MKLATRLLLLAAVLLLIPGTVSAQMRPGIGGATGAVSGMPVSSGTIVGGISSLIGIPISTMGTGGTMAIGEDGTAYLLLDPDYSDLKAVKTPVAAIPLVGQGWKTSVTGVGSVIAAGVNGVVIATAAVMVSPMPLLPATGAVFPVPSVAKVTLTFLKLSGAVLRDPVTLDGTLITLAIKKTASGEYVYALARATTVVVPYDPTTGKSPYVSKLKLTIISLTDSSSRTVDVASELPEQQ